MLSKVEARTAQGYLLSLPLADISSGFAVEDVDGLDPVKATIVSTGFAQKDGTIYQSSRRENRNVTIKVELKPNLGLTSVKELRDILYGFFMPKTDVELRFYEDTGLIVNANGRVETCTSPRFTKNPTVDISVMCFDPDFVELEATTVSGSTVADGTEALLSYDGTVETGILFTMYVNRSLSSFTIFNRVPGNTLQTLEFASSLISGDVLKINTASGSKGAVVTRAGTDIDLLYGVSPQANWTKLIQGAGGPGQNYIRVYATGAAIPYQISYINRYGAL